MPPPQTLHGAKVEGQWKRIVKGEQVHELTPVLKGSEQQPFARR